jgi:hypothetical protein
VSLLRWLGVQATYSPSPKPTCLTGFASIWPVLMKFKTSPAQTTHLGAEIAAENTRWPRWTKSLNLSNIIELSVRISAVFWKPPLAGRRKGNNVYNSPFLQNEPKTKKSEVIDNEALM